MTGDELNEANDVNVVDGTIDVADAAAVQNITAYDSGASDYDIQDSAEALLSSIGQDAVVDSGVDTVFVTDSSVDAGTGAGLNALELELEGVGGTDIEFTVTDTAGAVASELSATGDELNAANDVNVVGGTIDVAAADAVQDITRYDAVASGYVIEDSAGSVLGDTGTILDLSLIHI